MAAGAGGQLTELSASGCIPSTDWLLTMPALRRLWLYSQPYGTQLHVSPAISALTALVELELCGTLCFPARTRLPASLERLTLHSDSSDALQHQASAMCPQACRLVESSSRTSVPNRVPCAILPSDPALCCFSRQLCCSTCPPGWLQVARLPRLASLRMDNCDYSAASLDALSRLAGSLTHLDISYAPIPGSLFALSQLQSLRLWDCDTPEGDDAVLSTALPHLLQLTRLVSMVWGKLPLSGSSQQCCLVRSH